MKNSVISGAYDLHIHTSPDYKSRKLDDLEMAQRVIESGMRGYAIKSHAFSTTDRAYLVNKLYPECHAIASITLNRSQGGIDPMAVETAARLGAKIVWFPTTDSVLSFERNNAETRSDGYHGLLRQLGELGIACGPVRVLDDNGMVRPEVYDVLAVIRQHGLIMGTGHLSPPETIALVKAAQEQNVSRIVITHASYRPEVNARGLDDIGLQQELIACGAIIEHCALPVLIGRISIESVVNQIRAAGADKVILSSDFGQTKNKYPDEGLLEFCTKLIECGVPEDDIRKMIVNNPKMLLGDLE